METGWTLLGAQKSRPAGCKFLVLSSQENLQSSLSRLPCSAQQSQEQIPLPVFKRNVASLALQLRDDKVFCSHPTDMLLKKSRGKHLYHHLFQLLLVGFLPPSPPQEPLDRTLLLQGLSSIVPKSHHHPKKAPQILLLEQAGVASASTAMGSSLLFLLPQHLQEPLKKEGKKKGIYEYTRHHFHGNLQCRWARGSRFSQSIACSQLRGMDPDSSACSQQDRRGRAWEGGGTGATGEFGSFCSTGMRSLPPLNRPRLLWRCSIAGVTTAGGERGTSHLSKH